MANSQLVSLFSFARQNCIPLSVTVEVCSSCNERCVHCCLPEHRRRGLTLEQYATLLDQLVAAGTLFLTLTGGEPFSRVDFIDIVREARRRRFSVTIFTNATLLTLPQIQELSRLHVSRMDISVYSANSRVHDCITGLDGSFARTIGNVKLLVAHGVDVVLKCPLMSTTFHGVADMKALAEELGVRVIFGTFISARDDGDRVTKALCIDREQMLLALRDPAITGPSAIPSHANLDRNAVPCVIVFNGGAVDPDGNVIPCVSYRVNCGNVLDAPFGEIWKNSIVLGKLRGVKVNDLHRCLECELAAYCSRCPGLAVLEDGDMYGCSSTAKFEAGCRRDLGLFSDSRNVFSV